MAVVVIVLRVDVVFPVLAKLIQSCTDVSGVNIDQVTACPNFDSNQDDVDAFRMIQL